MQKKAEMSVHFINIKEEYLNNEDIVCYFVYNEKNTPQEGDRVAIMKLGWKSLRDFEMFEFVSDSDSFNTSDTPCVTFRRDEFPVNSLKSEDLFQFCYISTNNILLGVGTPFQVINLQIKRPLQSEALSKDIETITNLKQTVSNRNKEISNLKEENAMLKECLRSAFSVTKNKRSLSYDEEIGQLKDLVSTLKSALLMQQQEIDGIKSELKKEREQRRLFSEIHCNASRSSRSNFNLNDLESLPPCPL